ncbi:MAG TPA: ThiF family adenylyltransferase [Pseudonocardiaceae bacterium]|nr:ThiF family adenylyltransferase [Pseudonocardiaceae bacterium]
MTATILPAKPLTTQSTATRPARSPQPNPPADARQPAAGPPARSPESSFAGAPPTSGPSALDPALPRRPRLLFGLPVLRRMPGEIQIGTDHRHALVISGVPDSLVPVLEDLSGRHTVDELFARAGPDHPQLHDILTGLAALGLLTDPDPIPGHPARIAADRTTWHLRGLPLLTAHSPTPTETTAPGRQPVAGPQVTPPEPVAPPEATAPPQAPPRPQATPGPSIEATPSETALAAMTHALANPWAPVRSDPAAARRQARVVVHGTGRVAVAVAALLAAAGIGWVHLVTEGTVGPQDTGCGYLDADIGLPRADAAAAAIRRAASEARTGPLPPHLRPDLVVLADLAVPDPALTASLVTEGVPHLLARASEGIGVVGPLVLPGHTSCLRCADLHATDVDGCWPLVAAQLVGRSRPGDLASVQAVAAFAAGQVLRALHPPPETGAELPESARLPTHDAALELDPFTGESRRVPIAVHPRCDCRASREPASSRE